MTHSDIKKKFLIEYDKDDITSSYPSLTTYEIATILDKAYLALIAQKVTGNNPRQAGFESDNKAIADIQPLITSSTIPVETTNKYAENDVVYPSPKEMMYFIQGKMKLGYNTGSNIFYSTVEVTQVTHELALKYMCTTHNKPWVEVPVCYMEANQIIVLVDPVLHIPGMLAVTYVKKPEMFTAHNFDDTKFELSDSMAEELINLAVIMAAETVESQRLTTKINTRPLES